VRGEASASFMINLPLGLFYLNTVSYTSQRLDQPASGSGPGISGLGYKICYELEIRGYASASFIINLV